MSFRPPFPASNVAFIPGQSNNNIVPSNTRFPFKSNDGYEPNVQNNFTHYVNTNPSNMNKNQSFAPTSFMRPMYGTNRPNQEFLPSDSTCNNTFMHRQQSVNNEHFRFSNSANVCPNNTFNSGPSVTATNNQFPYPHPFPPPHIPQQNINSNPVVNFQMNSQNAYFSIAHGNVTNQRSVFPTNSNASSINFQDSQNGVCQSAPGYNNVSASFNSLPANFLISTENTSNITSSVNKVHASGISNSVPVMLPSTVANFLQVPPPPLLINTPSQTLENNPSTIGNPLSEKEIKLNIFLANFISPRKENDNKIAIPEFRSTLKNAFSLLKLLTQKRSKLADLMNASEVEWNSEMKSITKLQNELCKMCSAVDSPYLNQVFIKLKRIKRKRDQLKKTKLNKLSEEIKAEENRKELHQKIDKWLDDIKEKNLKIKREVEMQKEADFILSEVRRKIQEAKRTLEKIKMLEKLRNARQTNAVQKGLRIMPEHHENFVKKVAILRETMLRQLVDYEGEEKALKVMLETEQEGHLEEKTQWELKRCKTLQKKRQNHINECLFGLYDVPAPTDPLYLFHNYHTSANSSIENLVQIRHHWDIHLAEDGESLPQQWIVPVAPSNSSWEQCLQTQKSQ